MYFQFANNKIKGRRKSDFLCTITDHLNLLMVPLDITTHRTYSTLFIPFCLIYNIIRYRKRLRKEPKKTVTDCIFTRKQTVVISFLRRRVQTYCHSVSTHPLACHLFNYRRITLKGRAIKLEQFSVLVRLDKESV